jgi:hypothetical protein
MENAPVQLAEAWKDFFITAAGTSAALVGLVIVAISVNVERILKEPHLPSRGGATVAALVLILVSSMAELIPQSSAAIAIEISARLGGLDASDMVRAPNVSCLFGIAPAAARVGNWNRYRPNPGTPFHSGWDFSVFASARGTVLDSLGHDRHIYPFRDQYMGAPRGGSPMRPAK